METSGPILHDIQIAPESFYPMKYTTVLDGTEIKSEPTKSIW